MVLLGPPASGKGTQGRRLAETLGLGYLSTGALLRDEMEQGTRLGKLAEPILARGAYLPDDLICPIFGDWLERQDGGWVLDGFPRSVPQAIFLEERLVARGERLDAAISLEVPFDELLARIRSRVECPDCRWTGQSPQLLADDLCPECRNPAGPRVDDCEENFRNRHAEFTTLTRATVGFYRERGLLSPCEATAPQDEVAARLLRLFAGSPA